jgi:hypothetical protein
MLACQLRRYVAVAHATEARRLVEPIRAQEPTARITSSEPAPSSLARPAWPVQRAGVAAAMLRRFDDAGRGDPAPTHDAAQAATAFGARASFPSGHVPLHPDLPEPESLREFSERIADALRLQVRQHGIDLT